MNYWKNTFGNFERYCPLQLCSDLILNHSQTATGHILDRYAQFKKYFSKRNKNDILTKRNKFDFFLN